MSGFRATGIYPFNSDLLTGADFIEEMRNNRQNNNPDSIIGLPIRPSDTATLTWLVEMKSYPWHSKPCSSDLSVSNSRFQSRRRAYERFRKCNRRLENERGESVILTSSPYKTKLEECYTTKDKWISILRSEQVTGQEQKRKLAFKSK